MPVTYGTDNTSTSCSLRMECNMNGTAV